MENSTIQKESYSFGKDYTDNESPDYVDLLLQDIEIPAKERVRSLTECETRYSDNVDLYDEKRNLLSQQKTKNCLNYICQSVNWTGYVIDIKEASFTAKLIDNNGSTTYEIADFDKEDISECDLNLLSIGATFYWSVGYANQYGQIIKQSFIRFKRSIDLKIQEFDSIIDNARRLEEELSWE